MAKVNVELDVDSKTIDASIKQQLSNLTQSNRKLKNQVDKLKRQIFERDEIVKRAQGIIEAVRDAGGFASDCFEGDC